MQENERVGHAKLKELILQANDEKSLKKLEAIGDYPETKFSRSWLKKCLKVQKLQGKYHLAIKIDFATYLSVFKSPIFKWSDLTAFFKAFKANEQTLEFLITFDLNQELTQYNVPLYYILGVDDWQTPYGIAQEYFNQIIAPNKKIYLIPHAGHLTMLDQPDLFWEALQKIYNQERYNQNNMINVR
jgi:pimeloyl-ACP methyl ester carboxylesterase